MKVRLIEVPYTCGDERPDASAGPGRLVGAGAARLLTSRGARVTVDRVERGEPFRDSASSSLAVCRRLAVSVRQAVETGQLPLVLAGTCDVSKGVLSGFDHSHCGVVWFDAHGDFNTPESTISGFFAGMSLAVVTGHCYRSYWARIGNSDPVPEDGTLLLGVRDLDAEERDRLERSAIRVVGWREGRPQADVQGALDQLAKRVREVYVHVDLDALDPDDAPGVADPPVPGGISLPDMEGILHALTARFRIAAAALTTYNPRRDEDDRTLGACLRIIGLLGNPGGAKTKIGAVPSGPRA